MGPWSPAPAPSGQQQPAGGPPDQVDANPEDKVASQDQIAEAINAGTTLAAAASAPDDYLKFCQGVGTLVTALVALNTPIQPSLPPGGNQQPTGPGQG